MEKKGCNKAGARRDWILTLPATHYTRDQVEAGLSQYDYIGQLEMGSQGDGSGYLHWQVYIQNRTPVRFETLRSKFSKGHFEGRRGSKRQAHDYVTKTSTSQGVSIQSEGYEVPPEDAATGSGTVERLRDAMMNGASAGELILGDVGAAQHLRYIREFEAELGAATHGRSLRELEVRYVFGPAGCGKTRSFYEEHGFDDVYSVSTYAHPWDRYAGESVILLDEFVGQLDLEFLLKFLDRYPLQLPARYADRWAAFSQVVMLSNQPIEAAYPGVHAAVPEQWRALTRRVTLYQYMDESGVLHDLALPEAKRRTVLPGDVPEVTESRAGDAEWDTFLKSHGV